MFRSGQGVGVVIELKCQLTCRVLKRVSPFPRERLCPEQSPSGSEVPTAACRFGPWPGFPSAPTASLQNSPSGLPQAALTAQEAHAVIWPRPARACLRLPVVSSPSAGPEPWDLGPPGSRGSGLCSRQRQSSFRPGSRLVVLQRFLRLAAARTSGVSRSGSRHVGSGRVPGRGGS